MSLSSYNVKVINYPATGESEIQIYQYGIKRNIEKRKKTDEEIKLLLENKTDLEIQSDKIRSVNNSLKRTKSLIYDYCRANTWDYFITLTFNKEKVNRYDYDEVSSKLKNWLDGFRRRNSDLKYVLVPELHKDGAYHFHGLVSNADNEVFIDSGVKINNKDTIYNFGTYNLGWTTATKIKDSVKVSNYITKYITKDLVSKIENKKRYWNSRNLAKGEIEEINIKCAVEMEEFYNNIKKITTREKVVEIKEKGYSNRITYLTVKLNNTI